MATLPQNVAFEQANQEIIGCVNYCLGTLNVPMYEIEIILTRILDQASKQTKEEYEKSKAEYEAAVREEQMSTESSFKETPLEDLENLPTESEN